MGVFRYARESDGRWIAEVATIPGCLAYGATKQEATSAALRLAERVMVEDRTELIKRCITITEAD